MECCLPRTCVCVCVWQRVVYACYGEVECCLHWACLCVTERCPCLLWTGGVLPTLGLSVCNREVPMPAMGRWSAAYIGPVCVTERCPCLLWRGGVLPTPDLSVYGEVECCLPRTCVCVCVTESCLCLLWRGGVLPTQDMCVCVCVCVCVYVCVCVTERCPCLLRGVGVLPTLGLSVYNREVPMPAIRRMCGLPVAYMYVTDSEHLSVCSP